MNSINYKSTNKNCFIEWHIALTQKKLLHTEIMLVYSFFHASMKNRVGGGGWGGGNDSLKNMGGKLKRGERENTKILNVG